MNVEKQERRDTQLGVSGTHGSQVPELLFISLSLSSVFLSKC